MSSTIPRTGTSLRGLLIRLLLGPVVIFLVCAGLFFGLFWESHEPIQEPTPLASISVRVEHDSQYHAVGRDELVFLRGATLEVHRIDVNLTLIRTMPIKGVGNLDFAGVVAFPKSPRALLDTREGVYLVSTETGQVEPKLPFLDPIPNTRPRLTVSQDERWVATADVAVDLTTNEVHRRDQNGQPGGRLVTLPLTEARASAPHAVAVNSSRLLVGGYLSCELWDLESRQPIRSHAGNRPVDSVAIHPRTGDYLAGYRRINYSRVGLGGAVRIWNADGERITTFDAHRDGDWPDVIWMAFSTTGEFLVTADEKTVKVWNYQTLVRR